MLQCDLLQQAEKKMKRLYITTKAWGRFNTEAQQKLTRQYEVIFTDYKTTREKIRERLRRINRKSLDRSINKLNRGLDKFSDAIPKSDQPAFDESKFRSVLYGDRTTDVSKVFWGDNKSFKLWK